MPKQVQKHNNQIGSYVLQYKIGSGTYSQVYLAENKNTGQRVAVKILDSEQIVSSQNLLEGIVNEIKALSQISEANIIRILDFVQSESHFYLVYEYCEQGSLEEMIANYGRFSEKVALGFMKQLLLGIKKLSSLNIIHRDIKPSNILFHQNTLKIADFGFCKILSQSTQTLKVMMGSPLYMAPEIIHGRSYSMKCDVYSLGVVFYKMVYGKCPYEGSSVIDLMHQMNERELQFDDKILVSENTKILLKCMLKKKQQQRMDWEQVYEKLFEKQEVEKGYGSETIRKEFQLQIPVKQNEIFTESTSNTLESLSSLKFLQGSSKSIHFYGQEQNVDKLLKGHQKIMLITSIIWKFQKSLQKINFYVWLSFRLKKSEMSQAF